MVVYKYNIRLPETKSMDGQLYTYTAQAWGEFSVSMPAGAQLLDIQEWRQEIVLWALLDPNHKTHESRRFYYVGTGQHIPPNIAASLLFIKTLPLLGGGAIYHFFERTG
mgnify:CR=1 FL=1